MFNEKTIQDKLFSLVGWRNTTLPSFTLDAGNIKSDSGLYYNDVNSLTSLRNLFYTAQPEGMADVDFNIYLTNLAKAAILDVCNQLVSAEGNFVADAGSVFDATDATANISKEADVRRGYEIQVNNPQYLVNINSINLLALEDVTVTVNLYNTNQVDALLFKEVVLTANNAVVQELDWTINFQAGGRYYIVIEDNDFTGDIFTFEGSGQMLGLVDVFAVSILNGVETYTANSSTFSMDYSIYKDWTDFLSKNRSLLSSLIQKGTAIKVAEQILNSTRGNDIERLSGDAKALSYEALNGGDNSTGLIRQYNNMMKSKKKELLKKRKLFKTTLI